jgi:SAM-dependent methyltransferase
MQNDVTELRDFYGRPLGLLVRRLLMHRLRARWRRVDGMTVLGLGFPTPYVGAFRNEARRIGALMPTTQGALVWPIEGPGQSVLVDEDQLPLPDNVVDRLLVIHCLETAEREQPLLHEIWRVLAPQGRLVLVVPNRASMWARLDTTPFGHGRPYSRGQLERLLGDERFAPLEWSQALYVPPFEKRIVMRSAPAIERLGARLWPGLGGVIMVEAKKELVALVGGTRVHDRVGQLVPVRIGGMSRDVKRDTCRGCRNS